MLLHATCTGCLGPAPRTDTALVQRFGADAVWNSGWLISFEHVVGESHKRWGKTEAKVIGCLEIKHKFVAAWLFEGEFAWLGPAEHARRVDCETSIDSAPVNAI